MPASSATTACYRCRYSLEGVDARVCPECGADLSKSAISLFVRRRRIRQALVDITLFACFVLALLIGGGGLWNRILTGIDYDWKMVSLILGVTTATALAARMLRRVGLNWALAVIWGFLVGFFATWGGIELSWALIAAIRGHPVS